MCDYTLSGGNSTYSNIVIAVVRLLCGCSSEHVYIFAILLAGLRAVFITVVPFAQSAYCLKTVK